VAEVFAGLVLEYGGPLCPPLVCWSASTQGRALP
jgi:hypothetical protein